jgi:CIC family chloride channel protein
VTLADLAAAREAGDDSRPAAALASRERPVLTAGASLWDAMMQLQEMTAEAIAVVDETAQDGRDEGSEGVFLGVIYETSIARAFMAQGEELRREEHGTS